MFWFHKKLPLVYSSRLIDGYKPEETEDCPPKMWKTQLQLAPPAIEKTEEHNLSSHFYKSQGSLVKPEIK